MYDEFNGNECPFCGSTNLEFNSIEYRRHVPQISMDVVCNDCKADWNVKTLINWVFSEWMEGITNLHRARYVYEKDGKYDAFVIDTEDDDYRMYDTDNVVKSFKDIQKRLEKDGCKLYSIDKLLTFDDSRQPVYETDHLSFYFVKDGIEYNYEGKIYFENGELLIKSSHGTFKISEIDNFVNIGTDCRIDEYGF